ncbi:hypothetical protein HDU76_010949, partial [Blyttiomyces sp. JEL0837]
DSLGVSVTRVKQESSPTLDVWSGPLSDGSKVLIALNRENKVNNYFMNFTLAGFGYNQAVQVRDLWLRSELGSYTGGLALTGIPAHGVKVLKVRV